jgi:N-acetylmuramoyl-L-alanine amidase
MPSILTKQQHLRRPGLLLAGFIAIAVTSATPGFASRTVTQVRVTAASQRVEITLVSPEAKPLAVKSFPLANPPRLVFDVQEAVLAPEMPKAVPITSTLAKQVRLGQFSAEPPIARLVVEVTGDAKELHWEVRPGAQKTETIITVGEKGPVELTLPTVTRDGSATVVRLIGAGKLARELGCVEGPPRVYVDLAGAASPWLKTQPGLIPIREIRMGPKKTEDKSPAVRLVLELQKKQASTIFTDGNDLVLAVSPEAWALPLPTYAGSGRLKGKIIVVDAGHGGKDVGAPAFFGTKEKPTEGPYEKDLVLEIAHRLAAVLKAEGATVTMTREDDTFIALKDRAALANKLKSDAFISLHCNSCEKPNTLCGTSVYYDHEPSKRFAELVQRELIAALGTKDNNIRNANFAVIRRTEGPGILIETAFINHDEDRRKLQHPYFQERLARSAVDGLVQYLLETNTAKEPTQ